MTSPQDKYADVMRSSQEAVVEAFESWTKNAQNAMTSVPGMGSAPVPPQEVIDQVFDFAGKLLEVQRDFAKSLASTAASAAQSARDNTESMSQAVRAHAEGTQQAVRDAAEGARRSAE